MDSLLQVLKKKSDFWLLTLYPATWLNLCSSNSFLMNSLIRVLHIELCHLWIKRIYFFHSYMDAFKISFSWVIALTILNGSGENGHSCLVFDLREKLSIFQDDRFFFLNWPLSCWESSLFFLVFYNSFCFYSLLEVVSWSLQQFCRTISVFKAVSVCFMYFVSGIYQLWLLYSLEDAIGFRMCFNLINVQFNYYNC